MPNFCRTVKPGLAASLLTAALLLLPPASNAEEQPVWHHATSSIGEPKYKDGFARFDYVNPDAPKGGELRLSESGTFDSFNPILAKGEVATAFLRWSSKHS